MSLSDPHTQQEVAKYTIDAGAGLVTLGSLFGYLPEIAALTTIIWTVIRIIETKTVQRLIRRWRK